MEFLLEYNASETEGEEYQEEPGPPGGHLVIINKINVVLFFCINHIIFFKIQMHNYFCFCSVQFPNLLFLMWVQMKHYPLLPRVRVTFAVKG